MLSSPKYSCRRATTVEQPDGRVSPQDVYARWRTNGLRMSVGAAEALLRTSARAQVLSCPESVTALRKLIELIVTSESKRYSRDASETVVQVTRVGKWLIS